MLVFTFVKTCGEFFTKLTFVNETKSERLTLNAFFVISGVLDSDNCE